MRIGIADYDALHFDVQLTHRLARIDARREFAEHLEPGDTAVVDPI